MALLTRFKGSTLVITTISLAIAMAVFVFATESSIQAQPVRFHQFGGNVTVDGSPAQTGLKIEARLDNNVNYAETFDGNVPVTSSGTYGLTGASSLRVCGDTPSTSEREGGANGDVIEFFVQVGGQWFLAGTSVFEIGGLTNNLGLTVNTSDTPAGDSTFSPFACKQGDEPPTPTATSIPPTPTATSTPAPAGGGGGGPAATSTATPTPTSTPIPEEVIDTISAIQSGAITHDEAADILTGISPEDAAVVIQGIDDEDAAAIFEAMDAEDAAPIAVDVETEKLSDILSIVSPEQAANILELLPTEKVTEIVQTMDEDKLVERLPLMSPDKLFEIQVQVLFDNLPSVPASQLAGEIPPVADPSLPLPQRIPDPENDSRFTYVVSQTGELVWVVLVNSPAPIDKILGKFARDIPGGVQVAVEGLEAKPPDVQPELPPGQTLSDFFGVDIENADPQDIIAVYMTFFVQKTWLQSNSINRWSIRVNRFNQELNIWVPISTKQVRESEDRIFYSVVLPGFSVLAITGSEQIPEQVFEVTDLSITPSLAFSGQDVTVSVMVRNTSATTQVYPASLWIDSTVELAQSVTLEAGEEPQKVSFIARRDAAGTYQVRVDRLLGEFTVGQAPPPTPPPATSTPTPTATPAVSGVTTPVVPTTPTPTPTTAPPTPTATATPIPMPTPTATPISVPVPGIGGAVTPIAETTSIAAPVITPTPVPIDGGGGLGAGLLAAIIVGVVVAIGAIVTIGQILYRRGR
ncbi:MAG: PGF-pre-PGF domain-containing protein [Chloroflexi bacterium]|nr:PGF-pre-PGF domain-containing protein [Chloroflexota bacterium]